ncbi:hypothetical protein [Rhizobium leguminosarum]|uniref:hypothetical protein n=1 Tax=Rhizobium leguminosarum TaxID=384 RepID=UPI0004294E41|nr:hypothetical protein [Rhizobium leguminosarum]
MTFWDGFLPALGVFAAAGVAYVTWRFWKWVIPAAILLCAIGAALIFWPQIAPKSRFDPTTGKPTTSMFDDLIPNKPNAVGCDNPFGKYGSGGQAWLELCKDDPAYIEMEKEWAIKEAQAKAAAAAKAEQDSKAAAGR